MAVYVNGNVKTFPAGEALEAFRRCKIDASGNAVYADAGEAFDGITEDAYASGAQAALRLRSAAGTFKVTAAGAAAVAADLYGADDGKVSTTESGSVQFRAFEAATADGDIVEVGSAD